jgi:XTP/dITP diphosphohydrolase
MRMQKLDKLLIATTNPGKIREIRGILEGAPLSELIGLDSLPGIPAPDETGQTFAENARMKALYYNRATGLPSAADDSGLEIDALDGAPGIHSARWEGDDYAVKFRRIYELLAERGERESPARFVCAVALAVDGRIEYEAEGTVEGEIAESPRGTHGFGYDPIFYYPQLGRTLGELPDNVKATLSHRGGAFRKLRKYLDHRGNGDNREP